MKLISMTDFILEQNKKMKVYKPIGVNKDNPGYITESTISDTFMTCLKYAIFLKETLKLEMFVPCDEDGNVLEKYIKTKDEEIHDQLKNCRVVSKEEYLYEKAKEKVLFEGFELIKDCEFFWKLKHNNKYFNVIKEFLPIEWLIGDDVNLTTNAIKRFFI